jgi:TetR/AcrR family transcriptional regulator, repressor for neighboring sulfatase
VADVSCSFTSGPIRPIINIGVDSSHIDMRVNSTIPKVRRKATRKRVRRSPTEAREAILVAARARLLRLGLEGLKITEVAREAGMSHATLLHHFGSSDEMRRALVERMANALLAEFIGLLGDGAPDASQLGELFTRLFAGLSDNRHAQLFAWFALTALDRPEELANATVETRPLVTALLEQMMRHGAELERAPQLPRYIVLLVVTAAIGLGVAGPWLKSVQLLESNDEMGAFAHWFAEFLLAPRVRT